MTVRTKIKMQKIEAVTLGEIYIDRKYTKENFLLLPEEILTEIDYGESVLTDPDQNNSLRRSIVVRTIINLKKGMSGHPTETAKTVVELGTRFDDEKLLKEIPEKVHEKSIWEAIEEHKKICTEIEKNIPATNH